jgi:dTDP-4-dehydrorhamnose 3,5-epimerase
MKIASLAIPDVLIIEPFVYEDSRGFFFESFRNDVFKKITSLNVSFVQENHSKSFKGVLRGLHYQINPKAQGKLVRVIQGEVLDVVVDIRRSSPTFGKYVAEILTSENKKQIWIPAGFAHGFLTLSETAEFLYKTTDLYSPEHERCILWSDSILNISWPENIEFKISSKDLLGKNFLDAEVFS